MKKYLLITGLLFVFNLGFSQFGTRYEEVQIVLKNGTTIDGFGRLWLKELEFKDLKRKNRKKIPFEEIETAKYTIYSGKNKSVKNEFTLVGIELAPNYKNKKSFILAEEIFTKEKIKIYGVYFLSGGGAGMGVGAGGQISVSNINLGSNVNNYAEFYCTIKGEKYPRVLYNYHDIIKTFKIMGAECFEDCKVLSDKIKNKEFTKNNIQEIGNFYNDNCN